MKRDSILFASATDSTGRTLLGGAWRLWMQEGFPLEMLQVLCAQRGLGIDWREAMTSAAQTNNLPACVAQMEQFIPRHEMSEIKAKAALCVT